MTSSKTSAKDSKVPARDGAGEPPFWRRKTLSQMTREERESLCDGCAKSCLIKPEYEDTGDVDHTNLACRRPDTHSCGCTAAPNRRTPAPPPPPMGGDPPQQSDRGRPPLALSSPCTER